MNYLIVGASSGLGRDLAYTLSEDANNLTLISRDMRDLNVMKSDIESLYQTKVNTYSVDLASKNSVATFLNNKEIEFSLLDGVLFPIGMMSDKDFITGLNDSAEQINNANFLSIVKFVEKITPIFKKKK